MTAAADQAPRVNAESALVPDVDFDLHGFVGLRLLAATAPDVAMLTRQIGPVRSPLARRPDITVRFVDRIDDEQPMTYAEWLGSGFTDSSFYVLRGRDGVPARALLPLGDIGTGVNIVCERRAGSVPHLLAIINLVALSNGVLPLHASAFVTSVAGGDNVGVLATGWAKGGKTETLLAFASRGARYVGDEWVYVTPDGSMFGVPEPIRLWHWHVRQLPDLLSRLPRSTRLRLAALPAAARLASALSRQLPTGSLPSSVLRRAAPVIGRQAYVQVPPAELFGTGSIAPRGTLDALLLLVTHDREDVSVHTVAGGEVGQRMLASLEEERAPFMACYREFRFGFPALRSETVESAPARERELMDRTFGDRLAHVVRHPYPISFQRLVEPISEILISLSHDQGKTP
ncbi:MAG: hypothetical protein H0V48_05525 [Nocardioidaceae bacterium]|nr:hypothetical protein [Nocardioidaceae bacterium]